MAGVLIGAALEAYEGDGEAVHWGPGMDAKGDIRGCEAGCWMSWIRVRRVRYWLGEREGICCKSEIDAG